MQSRVSYEGHPLLHSEAFHAAPQFLTILEPPLHCWNSPFFLRDRRYDGTGDYGGFEMVNAGYGFEDGEHDYLKTLYRKAFRNFFRFFAKLFFINQFVLYFCGGGMAERSIAAVLKTVDCNRSGGSNPSSSARN